MPRKPSRPSPPLPDVRVGDIWEDLDRRHTMRLDKEHGLEKRRFLVEGIDLKTEKVAIKTLRRKRGLRTRVSIDRFVNRSNRGYRLVERNGKKISIGS